MPEYLIILGCILAAAVIGTIIYRYANPSRGHTPADFQRIKNKLKPYCSEQEFLAFMDFLYHYDGGYIKKRGGQVVKRDYLGREKGDLKGIFFRVVAPNPNLHSYQKEEYRKFIRSVGVTGVDERPDYETRDSALRNRETDFDEYQRKEAGNRGEQIVRDVLKELETYRYSVINGAKLRTANGVREYDHIVIGTGGVFVVETKAFGMTDGNAVKAGLFIDPGDKWILRKNHTDKELVSPTEQITAETAHLSGILRSVPVQIHPVVALSNTSLFIKQNIPLSYQVVRADQLVACIRNVHDHLSERDIRMILHEIDESRIN